MIDARDQARIVRARAAAFRAALDRAGAAAEPAAARRLVQVYDGGAMPTAADRVYYTHPVELDGAETEGAAGSPAVDASTTIPVVVLRHAPSVGDQLVATAVGGRWVAERGGAPASTTICVTTCTSPPVPVYGASVQLYSGSTLVDSCTTGSSGCCTFAESGTYTVQVTISGTVEYSGSRTLSGGTITINVTDPDVVCCGGLAVPTTLTLTDALGSMTFSYWPGGGSPAKWTAGRLVTVSSCPFLFPEPGICVPGTVSDGPTMVCYTMTCPTSGSVFTMQRSWAWIYESDGVTPAYYQQPAGTTAPDPGTGCGPQGPGGDCPTGSVPVSTGTDTPASSPFAASFAMATVGSPPVPDPVGGAVVVSA